MKCPTCPDATLLMSERQGVEIDYCPSCRGVWLDRGELDKLIALSAAPAPTSAAQAAQQPLRRNHSISNRLKATASAPISTIQILKSIKAAIARNLGSRIFLIEEKRSPAHALASSGCEKHPPTDRAQLIAAHRAGISPRWFHPADSFLAQRA